MEQAIARMAMLAPHDGAPASSAVQAFLDDTRTQASVLVPMYKGLFERNAGNDAAARSWFGEALTAARSGEARANPLLEAFVHGMARRYPDAIRAFDGIGRPAEPGAGSARQVVDDQQSASPLWLRQELERGRRVTAEQSFSFMVRVEAFDRAEAHLRELSELGGPDWWAQDRRPWRHLSDIAEMHEGLGRHDEALRCYERAIEALEAERHLLSRDELKTALAADFGVQHLYFRAVRAAIKLAAGNPARAPHAHGRAFALSEQARARALLDMLEAQSRVASEKGESSELARWRELNSASQLWRGMLARATNETRLDLVSGLQHKVRACEDAALSSSADDRKDETGCRGTACRARHPQRSLREPFPRHRLVAIHDAGRRASRLGRDARRHQAGAQHGRALRNPGSPHP